MYEENQVFSFILALMFGQLYNSDLWVATKVLLRIFTRIKENDKKESGSCLMTILAVVILIGGLLPFTVGQILPPIIDNFALPFTFFFAMFGINIDENQFEFDREKGDENNLDDEI